MREGTLKHGREGWWDTKKEGRHQEGRIYTRTKRAGKKGEGRRKIYKH